ncbi:hypothetical protein SFRURICE_007962 [Spodoptera frugiperda]|nr:hypothetical protein SFRURICE_007962 [Spodoptera frugiperda]
MSFYDGLQSFPFFYYLIGTVPSATFHQLPSSSYLPVSTYRFSAPTYSLRFIIYLHLPFDDYLPSPLLSESADLVTSVTFTPTSAGLPCITDGWTTVEPRATYPLHRLLTRIVVFNQRTRFHYALDIQTHTRLNRQLPTYLPEYKIPN